MTTTAITPFVFEDALVRVYTDENENPWFIAKDVCRILDLSNVGQVVASLDEDEKKTFNPNITTIDVGVENILNQRTIGKKITTVMAEAGKGGRDMYLISESGLYSLIFRSRKPEAKRFRKWVTGDVLPTLRRTGSYTMPTASKTTTLPELPPLPQEALTLRKALRQRLWQDALQTTRLDGGNSDDAVRWFHYLCRMTTAEPSGPESVQTEVNRFYHECCTKTEGADTRFAVLYEAFRKWRRGKGHMPSQKTFGEALNALTGKRRSNGIVYRDISIKSQM